MKKNYIIFLLIVLLLFFSVYHTQQSIVAEREEAKGEYIIPSRFAGATILGFKDVVADILWVEANGLFWEKKYLKVIPLFRIITWIDPHYIQVYAVGAWHFAWNLPPLLGLEKEEEKQEWYNLAISFLKEGIENNPKRYDLYFELGWLYYQKLKQYDNAAKYFSWATNYDHPIFVEHILAHAYKAKGDMKSALEVWKEVLKKHPDDNVASKFIRELEEQLANE